MSKYIIVFIVVVIITFTIVVIRHYNKLLEKERTKFSIKESMDLAALPIISLCNNGNRYNFLLDTGSTESHIKPSSANTMKGNLFKSLNRLIGSTGEAHVNKGIAVTLNYKNLTFDTILIINEGLEISFDSVQKEFGVKIDGILGSLFFQQYKYIIDFAELTAYKK